MDLIEKILADRPTFHRGETEISRTFNSTETFLPRELAQQLGSGTAICHGIEPEVVRYLAGKVQPGTKTLETGSGLTTLAFAIHKAAHVCITPSRAEIDAIRSYAQLNNIGLDSVSFVAEPSEVYLPRCEIQGLDLVLLDGKHAFPWPMLDWFYTADRLKQGGLMVIDDVQLPAVRVVQEFMRVDPGWKHVTSFGSKTEVFEKVRASIHDVAWHMQPWSLGRFPLVFRTRAWAGHWWRKAKKALGGGS
jgi:predicted O-methyltransferase YrrM